MESVYLSPNSLRVLTSISTHLYEYDLVTLRPLGEPGYLGDLTRVQTASHTLGFSKEKAWEGIFALEIRI